MKQYVLQFRPGKILELGGGQMPMRDTNGNRSTFNMDIAGGPTVDLVHDLSKPPWPIKDQAFDHIFTKYCIEHVEWKKVDDFIKEMHRVIKPGGKVVVFTANLEAQIKKTMEEGINKGTNELIFGSQEFPAHGGCHKCGFSPKSAKAAFKKAGFNFVKIFDHPNSATDMIIEAYKISEPFEREYFEDGTIGYKEYRDFATHFATVRHILKFNPESVIDVGGGRGYIARHLENKGVEAHCLDISKHCWHNRATNNFHLWDARKTPWILNTPDMSFEDKSFDLCFSMNFLEHIPEDKLDEVIKESVRVSKRGLHGIHMTDMPFEEMDTDIDITHQIEKPKSWWEKKFKSIAPDYKINIEHPRMLEYDDWSKNPPITIMPRSEDSYKRLNLGSFLDMFYGWQNIDIIDLSQFAQSQKYDFLQHDLRKDLPQADNSIEQVISNHLVEHLTRDQCKTLLKECYRVMKNGAVLRISTPDTKVIIEKYLDGSIKEWKYANVGIEQAEDDAQAFFSLLTEGHHTCFDEESLKKMLKEAGFNNINRESPFESRSDKIRTTSMTTHPFLSLVLECEKI